MMRRTRAGTLVVVDGARKLKGLLTERDIRFVDTSPGTVASRMTPIDQLVVGQGELTLDVAEQLMVQRKIKKLPLVDARRHVDRADHRQGHSSAGAAPVLDARRDTDGCGSAPRLAPPATISSAPPSWSRPAST